ncbi:MAG: choice-of-anchor Q domain-containing protein [Pseudomonadota bacterium]
MKKLGILLLLGSFSPLIWPADFCVTNSAQLQLALNTSENNGQSDTIRIAAGSYTAPSGGFIFFPPPAEDGFDLEISGGWTDFFGNPCGQLLNSDPEQTVISGGGSERVLEIRLPQAGSVDARNLSFVSGQTDDVFGGGGLRAYQTVGQTYAGTLTVENNIFLLNTAETGGGLYIGALIGTETVNVRVLNNLFVGNSATQLQGGAGVIQVNSPSPRGGIGIDPRPAVTLAHNTVVDNTSVQTIGGFWMLGNVTNLYVASNNLWGNSGNDLEWTVSSDNTVLRNNNIQSSLFNVTPEFDIGNISVTPQYVDCGALCVDRIPASGSPLLDAGYQPLAPFQPWTLPANDLNGGPRVRGTAVDIGAYEGIQDRLFSDRFEN